MSDWDAFSPLKYTTSWTLFLCIFLLSIWSLGDIYYHNQTFALRSGHSETLGHAVKSEGFITEAPCIPMTRCTFLHDFIWLLVPKKANRRKDSRVDSYAKWMWRHCYPGVSALVRGLWRQPKGGFAQCKYR